MVCGWKFILPVFASLAPKTLAHELRETSDVEVARFMNLDVTIESLGINGTDFQNLTISDLIVTPVGKRYKKAVWANETIHWKYIHQGEPTTNHSEVVWEEGDPETLPELGWPTITHFKSMRQYKSYLKMLKQDHRSTDDNVLIMNFNVTKELEYENAEILYPGMSMTRYGISHFIYLEDTNWHGTNTSRPDKHLPTLLPGEAVYISGLPIKGPTKDDLSGRTWTDRGCHWNMTVCGVDDREKGLIEMTWGANTEQQDINYDYSNVDAWNMPVLAMFGDITDENHHSTCQPVGCTPSLREIDLWCPEINQVNRTVNGTVYEWCRSDCQRTGSDEDCCRGEFNDTPQNCKGSSGFFGKHCPLGFSYAYDDHKGDKQCSRKSGTLNVIWQISAQNNFWYPNGSSTWRILWYRFLMFIGIR